MQFRNNVPMVEKGLGIVRDGFVGGRVGVSVAGHGGIEELWYFGRQRMGYAHYFSGNPISVWTKLFRLYLCVDGRPYNLTFHNTRLYPFGFSSEFSVEQVKVRHELIALNDAVVQRVKVLSNPGKRRLSLKAAFHHTITPVAKPCRTWNAFKVDRRLNSLVCRVIEINPAGPVTTKNESITQRRTFVCNDAPRSETWIGVSSEQRLAINKAWEKGGKYYFQSREFSRDASLFVVFAGKKEFAPRLKTLQRRVHDECDAALESYARRLTKQPAMAIGNKAVQSAITNIPPAIDALKVKDIAGAIRASDRGYWVWGWDSMVHSDALALWNDPSLIQDLLRFYRDLADKRLGIPHQLTHELKPRQPFAFPAQCLYIIMLYNHFLFTGNRDVLARYYPFAKWIMKRNLEKEVGKTGLIEGVSLYPDFPELLDQDTHDISVFNNSIFYQAARVMEYLSGRSGDHAFSSEMRALARRCRIHFVQYFFDEKKGYFVDSVSSRTFKKRYHYPVYAVLWVTPFAYELVDKHVLEIARFMKANFDNKRCHGLFMYPVWDSAFLADGNHMGAYMPVTEGFYYNVMKWAGKTNELREWHDVVSWYWNQHTIPEGLSYETMNEGITLDNPGSKQLFCGKAWYSVFVNAMMGLEFDPEGIAVSSRDLGPMGVKGIQYQGRKIAVTISGKGEGIRSISLNGTPLIGTQKIPRSLLRKENRIQVVRSPRLTRDIRVIKANGVGLKMSHASARRLTAEVSGTMEGCILLAVPGKPVVTFNGRPHEADYCEKRKIATVWICPESGLQNELVVSCS